MRLVSCWLLRETLIFLSALPILFFVTLNLAQAESNTNVLGWIERAKIHPGGIQLDAKLDTGADNCSLHARNIEYFMKGSIEHVRFKVRNRRGEEATIEKPVYREASIKRVEGDAHVRPVIRMYVCVGSKYREVDVNLADRSDFSFPMLIGRSFLSGNAIVDSSRTYLQQPSCDFSFLE